jgi:CheY-like chemotaxis protein
MRRLFLFEWNEDAAAARAELLGADGWEVERESADVSHGVEQAAAWEPDVVVLDLFFKASRSQEAAAALASRSATRDIPVVVVDGARAVTERMLARGQATIATTSFDLPSALAELVPAEE